jgi:hypothetical protein
MEYMTTAPCTSLLWSLHCCLLLLLLLLSPLPSHLFHITEHYSHQLTVLHTAPAAAAAAANNLIGDP